jgi:hypothetical protein
MGSAGEAVKSPIDKAVKSGIVSDQASEDSARGAMRKLPANSDFWGAERAKSGHLPADSAADALRP